MSLNITLNGYNLHLLLELVVALSLYIIIFVYLLIPRLLAVLSISVTSKTHVEDFPSIFIADFDEIWYDPVEKTLFMTDRFKRADYEKLMERIGGNPELRKTLRDLFRKKSRDTGRLIGLFEAILLLTVILYTGKMDILGWYLAAKFIALNARDKENQQYYILGTIINMSLIAIYALLFSALWRRLVL